MRACWCALLMTLAYAAACGESTTYFDTGTPGPDAAVKPDKLVPVGDGQPDQKKTDGKVTCSDKCTKGLSQCVGAQIQQCATQANGCADWNPAQDCPNSKACNAGACPTCTDDCTFNNTQCSGTKVQKCNFVKANGCYGYNTPEDCPGGAACAAGACPTCVDQCTPSGDTKCVGAQVSTCAKSSSSTCLDWGLPTNCSGGTSCTGKACPTCTNDCPVSTSQCDGLKIKTCAIGTDGCTHWGQPAACPNGKSCIADACPTCTDNCVLGKTQCSGTQVQTCELKTTGCLDWSTAAPCPGGTSCSNNQCACTAGDHRCTGNNLELCNSSLQWQLQQICAQACDAAKKQCAVTASCTAGTRRCNGLQVQICNATGTAWLTTETCAVSCATGLCTGACTPGAKRCNGYTPELCNAGGTAWTAQTACTTYCYAGACAEPGLVVDADANKTLDGEHIYDGDVVIKNSSTVKVPTGVLIIRAKSVIMDATSSISVTATGDDPRGKGGADGTKGCTTSGSEYLTSYMGAGGGSYGTAGPQSSKVLTCSGGGHTCTVYSTPGAVYGISDDEAAPGAAGGACSGTSGAKGGGMIAIYAETIDIKGSITANGLSGSSCAGGGSGGGILLRATSSLTFSGSASVAGGVGGTGAGAGGQGTIKLLYGNTKSITGVTTGKVFSSYMPPNDLSSATHPNTQRWYNDDAANFEIAWSNPFTQSGGYYPNLNTTYAYVPSPSNSLYQTPETVQVAASKLVAGSNYFHITVVGPAFDPSTIEGRFLVKINTTPPTITSSSHTSESTWYNNFNPFLQWTIPNTDENTTKFYYVLDRFYETQPDKSASAIPMNLADPPSSKRLLLNIASSDTGIWFFHLIAEDTMGYLTKQAARFRLQIGTDPGKGGVSGTITDSTSGGFVSGASVTLNRGVHTVTTNASGAYAFTNNTVFAQDYEVRVTKTGYKPGVQTVTVKSAQTATVNMALVPE
jgi:hypothetical protein